MIISLTSKSDARVGAMLGVYVSGISGSHINPAVTFASCVLRKFPWKKCPGYIIAQILGAFCGAFVVYGNYKSAIDVYEGGSNIRTVPGFSETATAGMFWSYPVEFATVTGQFFSEFIATSIMMFVIFALKDDNNLGSGPFFPLGLLFLIFGIGACFGWETGYALNLARDLGPRLMTYCVGYGYQVWTAGNYFFWVCPTNNGKGRNESDMIHNIQIPIVAPFCGCTFGGWLYDMFLYSGRNDSHANTP
jgi:aquaglyceroporin related protein